MYSQSSRLIYTSRLVEKACKYLYSSQSGCIIQNFCIVNKHPLGHNYIKLFDIYIPSSSLILRLSW